MKIVCDTNFKDMVEGHPTMFEKGDVCSVNDKDAARFLAHGWAHEEGKEAPVAADSAAQATDLNVASGKMGVKSTKV